MMLLCVQVVEKPLMGHAEQTIQMEHEAQKLQVTEGEDGMLSWKTKSTLSRTLLHQHQPVSHALPALLHLSCAAKPACILRMCVRHGSALAAPLLALRETLYMCCG